MIKEMPSIKDFVEYRCEYFIRHLPMIFDNCGYINLFICETKDYYAPSFQIKEDKFVFVKWNCEHVNGCENCYFKKNKTNKKIIDEILATCIIKDAL